MNITTDLEKLVALRDGGDLTQAEFEKAKAELIDGEDSGANPASEIGEPQSPSKGIPGLALALGVFAGNFAFIGIGGGDVARGFAVGAIAAVLVLLVYGGLAALKAR